MDRSLGEGKVDVCEVEVYRTVEREGFGEEFGRMITGLGRVSTGGQRRKVVVVVVFSPQGSESMLFELGYITGKGEVTEKAKRRWEQSEQRSEQSEQSEPSKQKEQSQGKERGEQQPERSNSPSEENEPIYVIVTIGPTTRDYLAERFGFEVDVCAAKPSPEGVGDGVDGFLREKGLI